MKVLVCGGRKFHNQAFIFSQLDRIHNTKYLGPIEALIHGGASGADSIAGSWALERNVPFQIYKARWEEDGKYQAGPLRNTRMLEEGKPDAVIAFPGGRGTKDMVIKAVKVGLLVIEFIDLEMTNWFYPSTVSRG